MSAQNDKIRNIALDDGIEQQDQEKTLTHEYSQALREAQTRLEALTTSFTMFIGDHVEPDILGLQCVIDDADHLSGTVRQLYQLTKTGKAAQQPEPTRSAQNQTDQADDPRGLDPNYRHHDMCSDGQDVFGFFESLNRNGFMAGGIINLNRRMYLAGGDSEAMRDDTYYSALLVRMVFEDSQALTRAWIDAAREDGQDHSQAGDPGIDSDTLASIEQITSQAINVLSSFTDLLAGVDPMTATQFMEAIDSLTSAINNINAVIGGSGDTSETPQA